MLMWSANVNFKIILFILCITPFGHRKTGCYNTSNTAADKLPVIDLIKNHKWRHFAGTTLRNGGILISGSPRNAASDGEASPAYNPKDPYLNVIGDFVLSATITVKSTKSALVYFYGHPPGKSFEKSIAIGIKDEMLQLIVHDGDISLEKKPVDIGDLKTVQFSIRRNGHKLEYYVNQVWAGALNNIGNLFSGGSIYLGAAAETGSHFILNKLVVWPVNPGGRIKVITDSLSATSANI